MEGKILVVEDEVAIAQLIDIELSAAGFEIIRAGDGATALLLATQERPDLLLVDFGLPDMDGSEVIHRLRTVSDAPIVVTSGYTDAGHKDLAMNAGATEYVEKPFDGEVLVELCRALLDTRERD